MPFRSSYAGSSASEKMIKYDGFLDLKIFIRLVIAELKLSIYSSLPMITAVCRKMSHLRMAKAKSMDALRWSTTLTKITAKELEE